MDPNTLSIKLTYLFTVTHDKLISLYNIKCTYSAIHNKCYLFSCMVRYRNKIVISLCHRLLRSNNKNIMQMITWNMTEVVDASVNVTLALMTSWICRVPNWQCCPETTAHAALRFPKFNYFKYSHMTTIKIDKTYIEWFWKIRKQKYICC